MHVVGTTEESIKCKISEWYALAPFNHWVMYVHISKITRYIQAHKRPVLSNYLTSQVKKKRLQKSTSKTEIPRLPHISPFVRNCTR